MTVGTAIVVSVGILAAAWIVTMCIGAWLANKKSNAANQLTKTITDEISAKIKANRDKK